MFKAALDGADTGLTGFLNGNSVGREIHTLLLCLILYHERWGMLLTGEANRQAGISEPINAILTQAGDPASALAMLCILHLSDIASSIPGGGCVSNKFELSGMKEMTPGSDEATACIDAFLDSPKGKQLEALFGRLSAGLDNPELLDDPAFWPTDFASRLYLLILDCALKAMQPSDPLLRFIVDNKEAVVSILLEFYDPKVKSLLQGHGQLVYCLGWVKTTFDKIFGAVSKFADAAKGKGKPFAPEDFMRALCRTFTLTLIWVMDYAESNPYIIDDYGNLLFSQVPVCPFV